MRWRLVLVDHLPGPGLPAVHLVELARCQIEEDASDLASLHKKHDVLQEKFAALQYELAGLRRSHFPAQPTTPPPSGAYHFHDDDGDAEDVDDSELLLGTATPPPAVVAPHESESRVRRSSPSMQPLPRKPATIPPPLPATFPSEPPPARNRTMGWSSDMTDPFPSSGQTPARNRTMLGFEANPEQSAAQKRLADEQTKGPAPGQGQRKRLGAAGAASGLQSVGAPPAASACPLPARCLLVRRPRGSAGPAGRGPTRPADAGLALRGQRGVWLQFRQLVPRGAVAAGAGQGGA